MSSMRVRRRDLSLHFSARPISCSRGKPPMACEWGLRPLAARPSDRAEAGREHEVVAVLRPEEVELAATREALTATYLGVGTVQSKLFTGALRAPAHHHQIVRGQR